MSADNWAICPACLLQATVLWNEMGQRVAEGYGKLPVEEFDALRAEHARGVDGEDFRTFREDYEIWVPEDDGVVHVSYSGECQKCKVGTSFRDERRFWSAGGS